MDGVLITGIRGTHDGAAQRREVFERSVSVHLDAAFGDDIHPVNRLELVRALGAAYAQTRHGFDARVVIPLFGFRAYVVAQGGLAPLRPQVPGAGPLALSVIAGLAHDVLAEFSRREQALIADCIDRTEISRLHPVDWRPRLSLRFWRLYLNLLAGRDRRQSAIRPTRDRRMPVNATYGTVVLFAVVGVAATAGLWFLFEISVKLTDALTDPVIWNLLFAG